MGAAAPNQETGSPSAVWLDGAVDGATRSGNPIAVPFQPKRRPRAAMRQQPESSIKMSAPAATCMPAPIKARCHFAELDESWALYERSQPPIHWLVADDASGRASKAARASASSADARPMPSPPASAPASSRRRCREVCSSGVPGARPRSSSARGRPVARVTEGSAGYPRLGAFAASGAPVAYIHAGARLAVLGREDI